MFGLFAEAKQQIATLLRTGFGEASPISHGLYRKLSGQVPRTLFSAYSSDKVRRRFVRNMCVFEG